MNPPFAVIATRFERDPSATTGMPVIRRFRATARNTASVDAT
jgi:hypothetical protein